MANPIIKNPITASATTGLDPFEPNPNFDPSEIEGEEEYEAHPAAINPMPNKPEPTVNPMPNKPKPTVNPMPNKPTPAVDPIATRPTVNPMPNKPTPTVNPIPNRPVRPIINPVPNPTPKNIAISKLTITAYDKTDDGGVLVAKLSRSEKVTITNSGQTRFDISLALNRMRNTTPRSMTKAELKDLKALLKKEYSNAPNGALQTLIANITLALRPKFQFPTQR